MARAVLWDVGNVIVRWNPRTLYSKIFSDQDELDWFLRHVCTLDWHLAHDAGVSFADNRRALIEQHPRYEAEITAWGDRFSEMISDPFPETEEAIEALHTAGVPQYALTNMAVETWREIGALSPAFTRLSGAVVSGEAGVTKPDPAIFRIACDRFGYAAREFLFVDDGARNIEAAAALGFATHHFVDPSALRPALERHGLFSHS